MVKNISSPEYCSSVVSQMVSDANKLITSRFEERGQKLKDIDKSELNERMSQIKKQTMAEINKQTWRPGWNRETRRELSYQLAIVISDMECLSVEKGMESVLGKSAKPFTGSFVHELSRGTLKGFFLKAIGVTFSKIFRHKNDPINENTSWLNRVVATTRAYKQVQKKFPEAPFVTDIDKAEKALKTFSKDLDNKDPDSKLQGRVSREVPKMPNRRQRRKLRANAKYLG